MKVVNAVWEQRNLGETAIEINLEKEDFFKSPENVYDDIFTTENLYHSTYTVVKIKTGHPWIGNNLQKKGFVHIETQISFKAEKQDVLCELERYEDVFSSACVESADSQRDIDNIKWEIQQNVFTTDRVALDPTFGIQKANERYANWVDDEVSRGAKVFFVVIENEKVGFYIWRRKEKRALVILGGKFSKYANSLMVGGYMMYACHKAMLESGIEEWYGDVSANNSNSYRLHEMFGYRIQQFADVYIRHNR